MAREPALARRPWAVGATVLGAAMFTVYITLILAQGDDALSDVLPWALLMAVAVIGAVAGAVIRDPMLARRPMIGSAILFSLLGLVSLASIGIGFLLTAFAASLAATRLSDQDSG